MGTRRKVCLWRQRRPHEFVVKPPHWKPADGDIVFTNQGQMMEFARASKLMLKQEGGAYGESVRTVGGLR